MRIRAGTLLCLLLLAAPLRADEVRMRKGKPLVGTARRVGDKVLVNPYGSTLEAMTWGVVEVPAARVEEIVPAVDTGRLSGRLDALPWEDVSSREVLLVQAQGIRDRKLSRRIGAEILRVRPDDARALKAVGGEELWQNLRRGYTGLDEAVLRSIATGLRDDSAEHRRRRLAVLARATTWEPEERYVERMARSFREPRGERHDVALTWPDAAGTTCSLYVPPDLHPLAPRPLVVALHGGMKDRNAPVLGTGRDAFALFEQEARRRGWLLVAPTARIAPWSTADNVEQVRAVIEEVSSRYAVDLDRIYLVGQGAGADGALALEARLPGVFAAVGAAGAAKPSAARGPTGRRVGVWLYHGAADEVVPVDVARKAAQGLLARKADFVYTELPGQGHGLPSVAEEDLFRYLDRHRRRRSGSRWPESSLFGASTADEVATLGDPDAVWSPKLPAETDALRVVLAEGWPRAEAAARALADRGVGAGDLVGQRDLPSTARAWAAWVCGRLRDFEALDPLADAVRAETDPFLRRQAALALRRLGVPEAAHDLASALEDVSGRYGREATAGTPLTFDHLDRTSRLLAALVEAYAVSAPGEEAGAAIEAHIVLVVLKDKRPVRARRELGEDPAGPRMRLARAVGRAYRTLEAETTLMDLLRLVLKHEPATLQAAIEGYAEGVLRDD